MSTHKIDEFLYDFWLATFIATDHIGFMEVDRRLTHRNAHHIIECVDHQRVAEQGGLRFVTSNQRRKRDLVIVRELHIKVVAFN